jgi:hypothetical protein
MVFDSVEKHMTAVSQYAIKERVQIRNKRNKKRGSRVIVRRGYFFETESSPSLCINWCIYHFIKEMGVYMETYYYEG